MWGKASKFPLLKHAYSPIEQEYFMTTYKKQYTRYFLLIGSSLLLLIWPPALLAQTAPEPWEEVLIDSLFHAQMPAISNRDDSLKTILWQSDTAVILINVLNFSEDRIPQVRDRLDLEEYYDGMIGGLMESNGAELLEEGDFRIENLLGRAIKMGFRYEVEGEYDIRETRLLFLDGRNYAFQYWYIGPESEQKRDFGKQFFDSIKLRKAIDRERQLLFNSEEKADKSDSLINWIFLGGLFLILLLGYRGIRWWKARN